MPDDLKRAIAAARAALAEADRIGSSAATDAGKAETFLARHKILVIVAAAAFIAGSVLALLV